MSARPTIPIVLAALAAVVAGAAGAAAQTPPPAEAGANRACLDCHGRPHIAVLSRADRAPMTTGPAAPADAPDAPRPGLLVTDAMLAGTVHAGLSCVDCHRDARAVPHARVLAPVACGTCHASEAHRFATSVHAEAAGGIDPAPTCADCHGTHEIFPRSDRRSTVHPLNVTRICGDCHAQHALPTSNGADSRDIVGAYMDSVHGRGVEQLGLVMAATCADCHGAHDVRRAGDPEARTARENIPDTCGTCHLGVVEVFAESVHGKGLAAGSTETPVCTDCHAGHRISRATTPEAQLDIVAECGDCHDRPELSGGRRASFYRTYRASYHGQVTELGSTRAARCSDCHGAHDILPVTDPASRLHPDRIVTTCRGCHPRANERFVQFDPHADYRDRARYPVLNAVWWYFIIVMSGAFGFFGLHTLLWALRSLIERVRHGPAPRPPKGAVTVRRFTRINRVNHALIIITFFGLVLTGVPLLFSDHEWAKGLAAALGGVGLCGRWHRILAVMLIFNFTLHFIGLFRAARRHEGGVRAWLFGSCSMLPKLRDARECAGMFRWFVRGGDMPRFGRWTYWEKFDYWAEIFGSLIIGGSGLLLWYSEWLSAFMPGWIYNVAMIVHGYEALLALGFIFTIHFFNAHLRRGKFPVDDVIFTGRVAEEELRHERPDEYERLRAGGTLEALRRPAPPPWQRRLAVVVGILAMTVGFTLVALIVIAGINLVRGNG